MHYVLKNEQILKARLLRIFRAGTWKAKSSRHCGAGCQCSGTLKRVISLNEEPAYFAKRHVQLRHLLGVALERCCASSRPQLDSLSSKCLMRANWIKWKCVSSQCISWVFHRKTKGRRRHGLALAACSAGVTLAPRLRRIFKKLLRVQRKRKSWCSSIPSADLRTLRCVFSWLRRQSLC